MLRLLSASVLALALATPASAASDQTFLASAFMDGQEYDTEDFAGRTVAVWSFCRG